MHAIEPTPEHRWLQQLIGDWTFETEASMGPDQPPSKFHGSESVRAVGDLWVICEGRGAAPGGGESHMMFTFGFDPKQQKFVGTFIVSMMAQLWNYQGGLDASKNVLTLDTVGASFVDENKLANYHDIIEIIDDNHRQLRSEYQAEDGSWHQFMTSRYTRSK